jgi:hypothetical protein
MLRVLCPNCEKTIGVPQATVNAVAVCPSCGERFRIPEVTIEPPADSDAGAAAPTSSATQPATVDPTLPPLPSSPYDDIRDVPTYGRRPRRYSFDGERGQLVRNGRKLVIFIICLVGGFQFVGVATVIIASVVAEKDVLYSVIRALAAPILPIILLTCLAKGMNGARITLAVLMLLATLGGGCLLAVLLGVVGAGPAEGAAALLPLLIILGAMVGIYPTVAITLLVSKSIRAYCDA